LRLIGGLINHLGSGGNRHIEHSRRDGFAITDFFYGANPSSAVSHEKPHF
jgi:hypothetical protein